ncbi:nuclear transport factor 2 family protein [Nocardia sp. CDC160]|uniref:nuclear transport factor 2 family protein n=1 Tax=Nocardia sp. CDC160 TaxID=3112166 RepID=UPI002DBA0875|nr:nuclear transport factor 2 family protein [Nocardia sp. CDC160]MEC3915271.1 nuclear transport factor 2 family protein [Nocardia sp. CDC160]
MAELPVHPNIELAVRYHEAVAAGATGDDLARFFHPDAVHRELPNALLPNGATRSLPEILDAAERGQRVIREQRFDIHNAVATGDEVALEVTWTGVLAIPLGALAAGAELRAEIATFLTIRDGLIRAQRNYDCYLTKF